MNIQLEHNLSSKNCFINLLHPILLPDSISRNSCDLEKRRRILGFSKYCQRKDTAIPSEIFDDLLKYQDFAIDALVLALMTGSNHTRAMAAFALKKYKTPQVVTILIEACNDQFEEVRIWAVKSLGEIGDKRGLRPLLKRLNDENDVVRSEAACALGKLNDIRAYEYLIEALKDTNENVRLAAFDSLVQLHQFQLSEKLKVNSENQEAELPSTTYPDKISGFAYIESIIERYKQPPEPAIAPAGKDDLTQETIVTGEIKIDDKYLNLPAIYQPSKQLGINGVSHFIDQQEQPIETSIIPPAAENLPLEAPDAILVTENPSDQPQIQGEIHLDHNSVTQCTSIGESGIETSARDESFPNNTIAEMLQDQPIETVEVNEYFNVTTGLIGNIPPINLDHTDSLTDIKNAQIDFVDNYIVENSAILKAITNENEVVRGIALRLVSRDYTTRTYDYLLNALKDDSLFVRSTAVWLLGELNYQRRAEALLPLMRDEMTVIREEAKSAYARMRDPYAIEAMVNFYRQNSLDGAEQELSTSLTRGEISIEDVLIPFLHDSNIALRAWATWALGEKRAVNAVTHIIDALNDESKEVQAEAIHALVRIGNPAIDLLIEALNDKHRDIQVGAAVALISLGESVVRPAIRSFKRKDSNSHHLISTILSIIGERAIPPLIQALSDDSEQVREHAIQTLGQFGVDAFAPLIQTLTSEDERIHLGAIQALSLIGDARAIEPLIPFLKHSNRTIRLQTVKVLSRLNDPKIVPSLIPLLFDENEDIRLATVKALGKLRDPQTILPLLKKLKDTSRNVQLEAAIALSSIGEVIPD